MIRMVTRDGKSRDDGTEPVWLPDTMTLEEAHQRGRTVKSFAGIIRNARGLGIRARRAGIAEARLAMLKDDDRIDAETAKVLIRVEHEVWGVHIDTPLVAVSRALRAKGWNTIPVKAKPMGDKKMVVLGAETSPVGVRTFRMPEGFLVVGKEITKTKVNLGAVTVEGTFWGEAGSSGVPGPGGGGGSGAGSSLGAAPAPDPSGGGGGLSFIPAAGGTSVATELKLVQVEDQLSQEVGLLQQEQKHQHRTLETWCREEFAKLTEQQTSTAAQVKGIGDEMKANKEATTAAAEGVHSQLAVTNDNVDSIKEMMTEMMKRLPPALNRKRPDKPAGSPEGKEAESLGMTV